MQSRDRRARDTRWLYRQERTAFKCNSYANESRSIGFLRQFAKKVWKHEAPESHRLPSITASSGAWSGTHKDGSYTSYCSGFTEIVLARHHRNILVLLHELTHALGPCVHGPKFVKLYFRLLRRWGGYNRWFLEGVAAERGILLEF